MKMLITIFSIVVMGLGLALSGWGPSAFEYLTGYEVPTPDGSDPHAMTVWSGIAFVRVFGALLFGLGAILLAIALRHDSLTVERAVFATCLYAGAVAGIQAQSIWNGWWGFVLAALLLAVGVVAYAAADSTREPVRTAA